VFGLWTVTCVTTIEQGYSEMVLRFLLAELRCVLRLERLPVAPDGRGLIASGPDSVLETVTNFEPSVTVLGTCCASPPMKSAAKITYLSASSGNVVRRSRGPTTELGFQLLNYPLTSSRVGHLLCLIGLTCQMSRAPQFRNKGYRLARRLHLEVSQSG
jgi:hypothetical protein